MNHEYCNFFLTCNLALHWILCVYMALEILSGGVGVLFVVENDEIITCDFEENIFYLIGINTCINCCLYCVTWRGK